jgi:uncharacterized membrane protein
MMMMMMIVRMILMMTIIIIIIIIIIYSHIGHCTHTAESNDGKAQNIQSGK